MSRSILGNLITALSAIWICTSAPAAASSDALWQIVSQQCVPNQKTNLRPAPCEEVVFLNGSDAGHAVLKDRNGPLQFLLLPTTKVSGIESPDLLSNEAPNYFYEAWKARIYVSKKFNASVPDGEISLTINSQYGRTQNQLHLHISCVRPDVKARIQQNLGTIGSSWGLFPGGILGHKYLARAMSEEEVSRLSPFQLLANELPGAKDNMKEFTLALVTVEKPDSGTNFVLLADRADFVTGDLAHAEELQDHECPQLYGPQAFKH